MAFMAALSSGLCSLKCLSEVSLCSSHCRLRKLFHSGGGVLNSLRESGWKLGVTKPNRSLNCCLLSRVPAEIVYISMSNVKIK